MFVDLFCIHADLLNAILAHLGFKTKCMLAGVNRFCAAKVKPLESDYPAIMSACPWASAPARMDVMFQGRRVVSWGVWRAPHLRGNFDFLSWGFGDNCIIMNMAVNDAHRVFTVPLYPDQQDFVQTQLEEPFGPSHGVYELADRGLVTDLIAQRAITRTANADHVRATGYGDDATIAVELWTPYTCAVSIAANADSRLLRHIPGVGRSFPPVLQRDGEMWTVDYTNGTVLYYGPRADRALNPDMGGRLWSASQMAAEGLIPDALRALRGFPVDTRFENGETLLTTYVKHRKDGTITRGLDELIAAGANINAANTARDTVFTAAINECRFRQIDILVSRGGRMSPNVVVDAVCASSTPQMIRELVRLKADVNADGNFRGRSPLLVAADCLNLNIVQVLLEQRADPFATDNEGHSAIHLARAAARFEAGNLNAIIKAVQAAKARK